MIILQFDSEEIRGLKNSTEKLVFLLSRAGHVRTADLSRLLGIPERTIRWAKANISGNPLPEKRQSIAGNPATHCRKPENDETATGCRKSGNPLPETRQPIADFQRRDKKESNISSLSKESKQTKGDFSESSESGSAALRTALHFLRETGVSPDLVLRLAHAIEQNFVGVSNNELQHVYDEAEEARKAGKINRRWVRFSWYLAEVYARAGIPWPKIKSPAVCRLDGITIPELEKKTPEKPIRPEDTMTEEQKQQARKEDAAAFKAALANLKNPGKSEVDEVLANSINARNSMVGEPTLDEIMAAKGFNFRVAGADNADQADNEEIAKDGGEGWVNGICKDAKKAVAPVDLSSDNQEIDAQIAAKFKPKRSRVKPGISAFAAKCGVNVPQGSENGENG